MKLYVKQYLSFRDIEHKVGGHHIQLCILCRKTFYILGIMQLPHGVGGCSISDVKDYSFSSSIETESSLEDEDIFCFDSYKPRNFIVITTPKIPITRV